MTDGDIFHQNIIQQSNYDQLILTFDKLRNTANFLVFFKRFLRGYTIGKSDKLLVRKGKQLHRQLPSKRSPIAHLKLVLRLIKKKLSSYKFLYSIIIYCFSINIYRCLRYQIQTQQAMSPKTDLVIKFLHVISWIIFIGLCIQMGTLIFNYAFIQFHIFEVKYLYLILDLSELFTQNEIYFGMLFSLAIGITALKAYTFFLITQIFEHLKLDKPFSIEISNLISKISYYIFSVGILGTIAHRFNQQLAKRGYPVENAWEYWNDYSAFLMMAAVVFVIAQIFKKGMELQSENELTV